MEDVAAGANAQRVEATHRLADGDMGNTFLRTTPPKRVTVGRTLLIDDWIYQATSAVTTEIRFQGEIFVLSQTLCCYHLLTENKLVSCR